MNDILMMVYVLVWPVIVAVMMGVMGWGVFSDARKARRDGEELV